MGDKNYLRLKIDLLLNGIQLGNNFDVHSRATMESISEGLNLIIGRDVYVTAAINPQSPYALYFEDNKYIIRSAQSSCEAKLVTPPDLSSLASTDGTPYDKIGTFQIDRVRISAYKGCIFGALKLECKFCEIGDIRKLKKNKLENINEFISHVEQNCKHVRHFLVSGGTPSDTGWDHFIDVCKEIRRVSSKSIYAMFSPPPMLNLIDEMVQAGVSEVAINLEFYNREVAAEIIPGKAKDSRERYFEALERSVKLLGDRGAVRSILIVGLEDYNDTLRGVRELVTRGVTPILSIFKPLKGTALEHVPPPNLEALVNIWEGSQKICEEYGQTLGPLCPPCQSNTLAIPVNQLYHAH